MASYGTCACGYVYLNHYDKWNHWRNREKARRPETPIVEPPYLPEFVMETIYKYNPHYGDDRICVCGHPYYRHFDTYDGMYPCGCKHCVCQEFREKHESVVS